MKEETIFQILTEDRYGTPVLQSWRETQEEADAELAEVKSFWPESNFWIEEGTDYIYDKCKGCGTVHANECHDAYGITTGHWCDECYDSPRYPYKKNRYDYRGAGERLDYDEY
jgi:Pyruvate/2-oxoacid:ferredoxin oxidoreductase delta subunit